MEKLLVTITEADLEKIYDNDAELRYLYTEKPLKSSNWGGPIDSNKEWAIRDFMHTLGACKNYMTQNELAMITINQAASILKMIAAGYFMFVEYGNKMFKQDLIIKTNSGNKVLKKKFYSCSVIGTTRNIMEAIYEVNQENNITLEIQPMKSFCNLPNYNIYNFKMSLIEYLENFEVRINLYDKNNLPNPIAVRYSCKLKEARKTVESLLKQYYKW